MASNITTQSIVKCNPEILSSGIDNETVLLSIEKSHYYGLDPVATRIWELLANESKVADILSSLLLEFEVSQEVCEKDLFAFLQSLARENLILVKNENT